MPENISDTNEEIAALRARNKKLQVLLEIGKELGAEHNLDKLLEDILQRVKEVVSADRVSLFLVDHKSEELYTKIAQDLEGAEIRIPSAKGLQGSAPRRCSRFSLKKLMLTNVSIEM